MTATGYLAAGSSAGDEAVRLPRRHGRWRRRGRIRRGRGPGRLPDPGPDRPRRQPADLPGLRRHLAQAAPGARRRARLLHHAQLGRAPRRAPARRGGDRRLRGRAGAGRRVHRRRSRRDRVHQERDRGAEPGRLRDEQRGHGRARGRAVPGRPRRRGAGHRDGAPRQPGALAAAVPAHRRHAALVRRDPGRPARPERRRRADQRPDQGRRGHAPVQRHRHRPAGRRDRRAGALPAARWWWRTAPSRCRTSRST